jgi:hypothetical protein
MRRGGARDFPLCSGRVSQTRRKGSVTIIDHGKTRVFVESVSVQSTLHRPILPPPCREAGGPVRKAVRADTDSTTAGGGGGHSRRVHRKLAGRHARLRCSDPQKCSNWQSYASATSTPTPRSDRRHLTSNRCSQLLNTTITILTGFIGAFLNIPQNFCETTSFTSD